MSSITGFDSLRNNTVAIAGRVKDRGMFFAMAHYRMSDQGIPKIFQTGWPNTPGNLGGPTGKVAGSLDLRATSDSLSFSTDFIGGRAHNLGMIIEAKQAPYLRFKVADKWVRVKKVVAPQRRYVYFPQEIVDAHMKWWNDWIMGK